MVDKEEFNTIIKELKEQFTKEYGKSFNLVAVYDTNSDSTFASLVSVKEKNTVEVNYEEWCDRYPYLDADGYKNYIEESIRKMIENN